MAKDKDKTTKKVKQVIDLEEKNAEYLAGWKRALADYENLKQDVSGQLSDGRNRIRQSLAEDLLPVMDNFAQAVNHVPNLDDQKAIENWLTGVTFIKKQFEDIFTAMGIEHIRGSGQFDPNLHESVETREDQNQPDQDILEEISPGWKIGEIVIRPAKVAINNLENK